MIIDECLKLGARTAEAGEFTKRAVLNGRIDLTRAEAAAKLIESKSIDAAKMLSRQLNGELQEFVEDLRDKLIEILAFVEVNIDYAEEDLPIDLQDQMKEKLTQIASLLEKTVQGSKSREGLIDGFKIALIGKPNVGKSSMLNALLRYERAIISDIAGTTRDTIEESLKIGTHLVKFVDTAGIRDAQESIERIGIERSIKAIEDADIVLALFDNSQMMDKDDENILQLIGNYQSTKEVIVVLNKVDLPTQLDENAFNRFSPITLSCKESVTEVIHALETILDKKSDSQDLILISKRQIDTVSQALDNIQISFAYLDDGELELFAYHLNDAINQIASITTLFERDEILDKMFGNFCLGK